MEKIRIRKLDLPEIYVFCQIFKDAPKRHIHDYDFYGAFDGERLIGGIVIDPKPDHFHYKKLGLFPKIIVDFFYVVKEYRGRGIGRRLFKVALKYKSIGLRTGGITSDIARRFYAKLGFKVVKDLGLVKYWYFEHGGLTSKVDKR